MLLKVGVPLLILLVLALIILGLVIAYQQWVKRAEEDKDVYLAKHWDGICPVPNPDTGAVCQREEFHTTNHYHVIAGVMHTW